MKSSPPGIIASLPAGGEAPFHLRLVTVRLSGLESEESALWVSSVLKGKRSPFVRAQETSLHCKLWPWRAVTRLLMGLLPVMINGEHLGLGI